MALLGNRNTFSSAFIAWMVFMSSVVPHFAFFFTFIIHFVTFSSPLMKTIFPFLNGFIMHTMGERRGKRSVKKPKNSHKKPARWMRSSFAHAIWLDDEASAWTRLSVVTQHMIDPLLMSQTNRFSKAHTRARNARMKSQGPLLARFFEKSSFRGSKLSIP